MTGTVDIDLYVTTKNTGPTLGTDPLDMLYLGPHIELAVAAVPENFQRYQRDPKRCLKFPHIWSALPSKMKREYVAFYMADGWWYSIARVTVKTH